MSSSTQINYYPPGVSFAAQKVPPGDFRSAFAANTDGILNGCSMTTNGSSLTIGTGRIVACGAIFRIDEAQTVAISGSSGFARILAKIDMTETVTPFQRVQLYLETEDTIGAFAAPTQEDINRGGSTYELPLCMMSLSGSGATILWTCGKSHIRAGGESVNLPAANWSSYQQTVYIDGVTPTSNVWATYHPSYKSAFQAAGVYASGQGWGTVTFTCSTVPSADLVANVLLL